MKHEETVNETMSVPHGRRARILVVEDETLFAKAICKRLKRAEFQCDIAATLAEAQRLLEAQRPDLILLDMRLPDGSGLDFLARLRNSEVADIGVVMLTAFGELEDAVAAMKLDALDYLKKPIDLDELQIALEKVLAKAELTRQLDYSRQRENRALESEELLGESPAIKRVKGEIERIAKLSEMAKQATPTVLILGETGTGKDLAARLLHAKSIRRTRPFVHVNCAALPQDLIESELFGHEKGAFTSAHTTRTGLIEAAEEGTVYLDEVAELPLELQPKLLAVLERRAVRRVGSHRERPVRAWFIAGTNRPLEQMVTEGRFRADLYYRLKVLTLEMPPLRDRGNDVVILARHFIHQTTKKFGLEEAEFSPDLGEALRHYSWPGNVRELAHLIERAVLISDGKRITPGNLMLEETVTAAASDADTAVDGLTIKDAEILLIRRALARNDGNVSAAARQLGITRMALRYRMKQYKLSRED